MSTTSILISTAVVVTNAAKIATDPMSIDMNKASFITDTMSIAINTMNITMKRRIL